jgi:hypothetical protein
MNIDILNPLFPGARDSEAGDFSGQTNERQGDHLSPLIPAHSPRGIERILSRSGTLKVESVE